MYYYEIYVENSKNIYTYKSKEKYHVGEWCIVNYVNSNKLGLIIDESEEENIKFDLSKIKYIIDRAPILSVPLSIIELIKWVKDYYLSDYYNVIRTVYPGILKLNYSKKAIYLKDLQEIERKNQNLFPSSKYEKSEIEKFNEYMKKKVEVTVATLNKNFSSDIIKKAEKEKSISIEKKLILKSGKNKKEILKGEILENNIVLNDEQKKAVDKIKKSENKFFLLKGITGSGKTEIYINLVKSALKENQGSIFLVPEISLTTQIIERFEKEFSDSIAILHSKLSDLEKKQEWAYIRSGDKKIVIGARSAIFAPVKNLKYIIIDEEHESSYKQDSDPRYDARYVALKRAEIENAKVLMGSATPLVEIYFYAKNGIFELLELNKRYNENALPKFKLVNMREEGKGELSETLLEETAKRLRKGEQILYLLMIGLIYVLEVLFLMEILPFMMKEHTIFMV